MSTECITVRDSPFPDDIKTLYTSNETEINGLLFDETKQIVFGAMESGSDTGSNLQTLEGRTFLCGKDGYGINPPGEPILGINGKTYYAVCDNQLTDIPEFGADLWDSQTVTTFASYWLWWENINYGNAGTEQGAHGVVWCNMVQPPNRLTALNANRPYLTTGQEYVYGYAIPSNEEYARYLDTSGQIRGQGQINGPRLFADYADEYGPPIPNSITQVFCATVMDLANRLVTYYFIDSDGTVRERAILDNFIGGIAPSPAVNSSGGQLGVLLGVKQFGDVEQKMQSAYLTNGMGHASMHIGRAFTADEMRAVAARWYDGESMLIEETTVCVGDVVVRACQSCCRRRVIVSWLAVDVTGSTLTSYTLKRDGVTVATLSPDTLKYTDNAVEVGNSYVYRVEANVAEWDTPRSGTATIKVRGWGTAAPPSSNYQTPNAPASSWNTGGCDCD